MRSSLVKRLALLRETAEMALDTLWANKMRSALTVLGVVIGITSIVSMTALIRGFDESLRDSIRSLGPRTIFVQRFGALSFSSGASFVDLIKRPALTVEDGEAIERLAPVGRRSSTRGSAPAGRRRRSACSTATSAPRRRSSWARARRSSTSTSPRSGWDAR